MATRNKPFAPGTPCWVDLLSSDVDKARQFYGDVLGWTAEESGAEFGGYVTFRSGGHRVAGLMANQADNGIPDFWNTYLSTDDAEATVETAVKAGANLIAGPMTVADLGSMAVLADPTGATVGIWQPGSHIGFEKYNEPGGVAWDELHSKDFEASKRFYAEVFGWQLEPTSDTDDFRYYTGQVDGQPVAGLMDSSKFLPPEVPSMWTVYFSVPDIDAAAEKVTAAGGRAVRPPEDTPFGRLGEFTDPTGALFKLHSEVSQG
ncbi:MAG TPA: VOC family protein [Jatrophihabitans sp.]|nr:VOC family protein [Jatrophihabitans sp.]